MKHGVKTSKIVVMERSFLERLYHAHASRPPCPASADVSTFFGELLGLLFPGFGRFSLTSVDALNERFVVLRQLLLQMVGQPGCEAGLASRIVDDFFNALPSLHAAVEEDVTAMFEGDPAAKSRREVTATYPGFFAIAAYRVAHKLHELGVDELPRMITEHAHSRTGIDIHPAAKIGAHFCIDHGTGIVIGETSVIGRRVKIYQGVTIGAMSVNKEDALKKRHPTLEDNVVVYAGATILGGNTVIGHDSVIGGNVWLTSSVPPNSRIYYQSRMYNGESGETDIVVFSS